MRHRDAHLRHRVPQPCPGSPDHIRTLRAELRALPFDPPSGHAGGTPEPRRTRMPTNDTETQTCGAGFRASVLGYPGNPDQVRLARADLRALLIECPFADDVILCGSELATNAVIHSRSRHPGGYFIIRAAVHRPHYAYLEVEDNGGPWIGPAEQLPGHGLDIIRELAIDWGIDGDDYPGRTVWARFTWPAEAKYPS
jgi:hypothetical protein